AFCSLPKMARVIFVPCSACCFLSRAFCRFFMRAAFSFAGTSGVAESSAMSASSRQSIDANVGALGPPQAAGLVVVVTGDVWVVGVVDVEVVVAGICDVVVVDVAAAVVVVIAIDVVVVAIVVVVLLPGWNSSSAPIEIEWTVNVVGCTWEVIAAPSTCGWMNAQVVPSAGV